MTSTKKYLKTRYSDSNGCVLCDNVKNQDGYMRVGSGTKGKLVMLHVLEWEAVNGKKPEGMELNHKCGNRACCNLDHLELICESKHASISNEGRVGFVMERKTDEIIAEVYYQVKYEGKSINQVCKDYDIKRTTLSSIMNKRSRCYVTDAVDRRHINNSL